MCVAEGELLARGVIANYVRIQPEPEEILDCVEVTLVFELVRGVHDVPVFHVLLTDSVEARESLVADLTGHAFLRGEAHRLQVIRADASPMGQVIPGGLLTWAFLSLIVVRVPFERWGHLGVAVSVERGQ